MINNLDLFNLVILTGAICGPIMVIGSMILLYRGSISLQAAGNDKDALSVELIQEIKLSTRYPALALFIIGFIFFFGAAKFAQEGTIKPIVLEGIVSSPDELVDIELHLVAGPWKRDVADSSGKFSISFRPTIEKLKATIIAPGYEKTGTSKTINFDESKASIGIIKLGKRRIENMAPHEIIPERVEFNASTAVGEF